MSCHNIGKGLNSVTRVVIEEYDSGNINLEGAKRILNECARAVNWCDGNVYEATDYIRRCRCGNCLKMVEKGEKLYSVWDVSKDVSNPDEITEHYTLASDGLCEECFDKILNEYCDNPDAAARERERIESYNDAKYYTSDGEHPYANNMMRW